MLNKWEHKEHEKVAGFDIDGVLNYYPDPWIAFVNERLGTNYQNLKEVKYSVPFQTYKDLKFEYRESGIKKTLKVRAGAKELFEHLKREGYIILIITSRPFSEHKTLYKQTTDWLDAGELPYDGILFGSDKYYQIVSQAPNLSFLVEDHRYYCNMVAKWGYKVFLMDNPYNQGHTEPGVQRVKDLGEVLEILQDGGI